MPFPTGYDETNPADVLILKNEGLGTHDAISALMGYDTVTSAQQKVTLINTPENNAQDPTPTTGQLLVSDLLDALNANPAELASNQVDNGKLVFVAALAHRELDQDLSRYISGLQTVFASQATNILAVINASLRNQARYEVLWGVDTPKITRIQWQDARES